MPPRTFLARISSSLLLVSCLLAAVQATPSTDATSPAPVVVVNSALTASSSVSSSSDSDTSSTTTVVAISIASVAAVAAVLALIYVRRRRNQTTATTPEAPQTREFSRESEFHTPAKQGRRMSVELQIIAEPSPPGITQSSIDLWDDLENLHTKSLHHSGSSSPF
ncbi:hypothetical protein AC1031_015777 [Aphanomyces cochlioides]|nr:hypothetical protein AC1031_015777 [Aphanomyces cochlioides]